MGKSLDILENDSSALEKKMLYGSLDVSSIKIYILYIVHITIRLICNDNLNHLSIAYNKLSIIHINDNLQYLYCPNNPLPYYYVKPLLYLKILSKRKRIIKKILTL